MTYIVQITNKAQQEFFTVSDALYYAKSQVYAPLHVVKKASDTLQHSNDASWAYGFDSVTIKAVF